MDKRKGVRKASESSIEIDFRYKNRRCKERIKLKPTAANLKKAARHREAVLDAIDKGTFDYATTFPDSPNIRRFARIVCSEDTLGHYLESWIIAREPTLKASTWAVYARMIRHQIHDAIGDTPLTEVTWRQVRLFLEGKDASHKTRTNVLTVLRAALEDAENDELIEANPLKGKRLRAPVSEPKRDEIDPFTADERQAILDTAQGQERNLLQFALWTGLRISELIALDWSEVDFVKGRVHIIQARTQHSKGAEIPKTAKSRRFVKLLPYARQALVAQKPHTYMKGCEVFQNPRTNERWSGDVVIRNRMWTRILKRAGVRYRYPYQMRHTYASMMLQAGEPLVWVSKQLGHSDPAFTIKTYVRWIDADAPEAGDKAVEMWGKKSGCST